MAKKKKNAQVNAAAPNVNELKGNVPKSEPSVPKFEIGVKGDEFDLKYRRAAANASSDADRLLGSLGRESKADKYNFLGFSIPAVIIVFAALSFILIGRGDIEVLMSVEPTAKTVLDGSYTQNLNYVYESTIPFGENIKAIGEKFGFLPKSEQDEPEQDPDEPDAPVDTPDEPSVTTAATQATEPTTVSTTPAVTTVPTTVSTEETTTEKEVYETFVMYAGATLNIRLGPSTNDAILGYYSKNDPVDVIEIGSDGWAAVLYNDIKAYVFAEYLSEKTVETTKKPRRTQATTTEEEPPITTVLTDEDMHDGTTDDLLSDSGDESAESGFDIPDDSSGEVQTPETTDISWVNQPTQPDGIFTMPE